MNKTKKWATILLMLALLGAAAAWPFRLNFWGGLLLAAFEASLVGALADWFAIVALFRHPMGLKFIPHTAIIPNNKKRIFKSIVFLVENEWLKVEAIKQKIANYEIMDKICSLLQSAEGKERMQVLIASVISNTVRSMEPERIAEFVEKLVKENFNEIKLPSEIVEKLESSVKELYGEDIIDLFIDGAKNVLQTQDFLTIAQNTLKKSADDYSNGTFFRRLGKGIGEHFDLINYGEASESIARKLSETLEGMKSKYNPHRTRLKQGLVDYKITGEDNVKKLLETGISRLIDDEKGHRVLTEFIEAVWEQTFAGNMENSPVIRYLTDIVLEQIDHLNQDVEKKQQVEAWIKGEALKIVERYHGVIGKLVKENLESLDDESFVGSLEEEVGDDLQWIRINGTVIGGLVGVVQYLITHLI